MKSPPFPSSPPTTVMVKRRRLTPPPPPPSTPSPRNPNPRKSPIVGSNPKPQTRRSLAPSLTGSGSGSESDVWPLPIPGSELSLPLHTPHRPILPLAPDLPLHLHRTHRAPPPLPPPRVSIPRLVPPPQPQLPLPSNPSRPIRHRGLLQPRRRPLAGICRCRPEIRGAGRKVPRWGPRAEAGPRRVPLPVPLLLQQQHQAHREDGGGTFLLWQLLGLRRRVRLPRVPVHGVACGGPGGRNPCRRFGYRAKYVVGAVKALQAKPGGGAQWLASLRGLELSEVIDALCTLPGVGPKVAACIALFSLDQHHAIPVDTHVWQIATRYLLPELAGMRLTPSFAVRYLKHLFPDLENTQVGPKMCFS